MSEEGSPYASPETVAALRRIGKRIAAQPGRTYFPPKIRGERQPVHLSGYVSKKDLGDLIYYIADMLEE